MFRKSEALGKHTEKRISQHPADFETPTHLNLQNNEDHRISSFQNELLQTKVFENAPREKSMTTSRLSITEDDIDAYYA